MKKFILILLLIPTLCFAGWFQGSRSDMGRFATTTVTYEYHGSDAQPADSDTDTGTGNTYIFDETCAKAGYIVKIEVWIHDENGGVLDFGIFSISGGDDFTDEHTVTGLAISNGLNTFTHADSDFDASDLPISIGEYIGWYITSDGTLEKSTTGGPGYYYLSGDHIDGTPDLEDYTLSGNTGHECQIRVYIASEDPDDP